MRMMTFFYKLIIALLHGRCTASTLDHIISVFENGCAKNTQIYAKLRGINSNKPILYAVILPHL